MTVYRFKSRETNDLVMMEREAHRILNLLGKDLSSGIIQAAEMASVTKTLTDAAKEEEREQELQMESQQAQTESEDADGLESIGLRKRIAPFLEMLRRCEAANVEVIWGV